ncbi:MAG: HD domain-containing protein [Acidobacteria bacterium]|nr:HD domain-containing protein [Acidobacteriota bacterium]
MAVQSVVTSSEGLVRDDAKGWSRVRRWVRRYVEEMFVVTVFVGTLMIFFFAPYKLTFLNFFYLPIFAVGYFVGFRKALTGSVFCFLLVCLSALFQPEAFTTAGGGRQDALFNITSWGIFLVLAGAFSGLFQERLHKQYRRISRLNRELSRERESLAVSHRQLAHQSDQRYRELEQLRQKNLVMESQKEKLETMLRTTMDPGVAQKMIRGEISLEKREVSVLFVDLKEFSAPTGELETITRQLTDLYATMEPIVDRFQGHLDKYTGDAMMCEFGVPQHQDHHALRAALSATFMLQAAERANFSWKIRLGVATGSGILGLFGSRRRSYTVVGEVANLAYRLQNLAGPGEALLDDAAARRVGRFFEVEPVRSFPVRRAADEQVREKILQLEQQVAVEPGQADLYFQLGQLHYSLREAEESVRNFERALELDSERPEYKAAYADACLKREEFETIEVKGFSRRVGVYRIKGLRNPLHDGNRFPESFRARFGDLWQRAKLPRDIILSHESTDASLGHAQVVSVLGYALATQLGLSPEERGNIFLAGCLQDLGKASVPQHLLNRGGPLSADEFKEVEAHVPRSVSIAKQMGCSTPSVLEIIENHHESFNGSGYPHGKTGDQIPLGARIAAVADGYSALTRWRPHRAPGNRDAALGTIHQAAGAGRYDPRVVQALGDLLAGKENGGSSAQIAAGA